MKITIRHDQNSIDPAATISDDQFPNVLAALETQYREAILAEYPDADIEFEESSDTNSIVVQTSGLDDPSEIEDRIQRITETVYEAGLFWESRNITSSKAREILAAPDLTDTQVERAIALASEDAKHWAAEASAGTLPQVDAMHLDWSIDADLLDAGVNDYAMQRLSFAIAEAAE